MRRRLSRLFESPLIRRIQFYLARARGQLDKRFFVTLVEGILVIVAISAVLITLLEKPWTLGSLGASFYWGVTTVLGQGDPSYITSPAGWFISWLLILFGVALFGTITGALIAVVIDFLLKEGQGMGASGYKDHIVVCGWNATARDLISELRTDAYKVKIVVVAPVDKNPAGDGIYFVKGDPTDPADLDRAGITHALAALIFPVDDSNDADMRSILTVIAIESLAPTVRTVAEVNNPRHADHFRRAHVDEILVSSQVGARLLARSALYPGLIELVADIVSGGEGSELYRVEIPEEYLNLSVDDVSARLRADHRATLLSISRGGKAFVNPPSDFRIEPGDDAVVVAESLGTLAPLVLKHDDGTGSSTHQLAIETGRNGKAPVSEPASPPTNLIVPLAAGAAAIEAVGSGPGAILRTSAGPAQGPAASAPTGGPSVGPTSTSSDSSAGAIATSPVTTTPVSLPPPAGGPVRGGGPTLAQAMPAASGTSTIVPATALATAGVAATAVLDPTSQTAVQVAPEAAAQQAPPAPPAALGLGTSVPSVPTDQGAMAAPYVTVSPYPTVPPVGPASPLSPTGDGHGQGARRKRKKKGGKG